MLCFGLSLGSTQNGFLQNGINGCVEFSSPYSAEGTSTCLYKSVSPMSFSELPMHILVFCDEAGRRQKKQKQRRGLVVTESYHIRVTRLRTEYLEEVRRYNICAQKLNSFSRIFSNFSFILANYVLYAYDYCNIVTPGTYFF